MGRFCLAVVVLLFSAGSCPAQRLVVGEKAPELKVGEWLSHRDAVADSRPTLVEFSFLAASRACVVWQCLTASCATIPND